MQGARVDGAINAAEHLGQTPDQAAQPARNPKCCGRAEAAKRPDRGHTGHAGMVHRRR
jgi:hypothetical protein